MHKDGWFIEGVFDGKLKLARKIEEKLYETAYLSRKIAENVVIEYSIDDYRQHVPGPVALKQIFGRQEVKS